MAVLDRFILALVFLGVTSCATTQQAKDVVTAGFRDDYSIRRRGVGEHEALRRYVNPIADWKKYTKVMIDPVQLWMGKESSLRYSNRRTHPFNLAPLWQNTGWLIGGLPSCS